MFRTLLPGPVVDFAKVVRARARHLLDDAALRVLERTLGSGKASALDVYFAYRLLLERSPDVDGFGHHRRRLRELGLSPKELAVDLMRSPEFEARVGAEAAPSGDVLVELPGFALWVDEADRVVGRTLREQGVWEPFVTRALEKLLMPGDTFVDVGANVGYFTLLAAKRVGLAGKVVALEPTPRALGLLEKSVAHNRAGQVRVVACAAGASEGTMRLAQPDRANLGSVTQARAGEGFEVAVRPLDAVLEGLRPTVIKIDVEGAEGLVLDGAEWVLRRDRPVLLVEYSPEPLRRVSGRDGAAFLAQLEGAGYQLMEPSRYDGAVEPMPASRFDALLAERGEGHLDLLAFPR